LIRLNRDGDPTAIWRSSEFPFVGLRDVEGEPRQSDDLGKEVSETMNDVGLPHVTLHLLLRHTHASQLITSGMDILTVSRRLGHSSPAITLKVYGPLLSPKDDAAAIIQATLPTQEWKGSKWVDVRRSRQCEQRCRARRGATQPASRLP
jgi:integrase